MIIFTIIATLNIIYIRKDNLDVEKMKHIPLGIQICNFGSSHGLNGFDYEDAEKSYMCFNFGLGGQSLIYDNRILTCYRDNLKEGCNVFIVISHFSFFGLPDVEIYDFYSKNRRYYRFLPPQFIERYDSKTDFYVNYLPALVSTNIIAFFETILLPAENWWNKATNHDEALEHGKMRYMNFIERKKDINGRRIYNHEAVYALYSMINTCRQIGANPILITTPYLKEYNDAVKNNDPEFYGDFYTIIDKVVKDTGVRYYDYSSDGRYTNNYDYFFNTDHLNRKGARIFTNNLLHEVLSIDVMPPE